MAARNSQRGLQFVVVAKLQNRKVIKVLELGVFSSIFLLLQVVMPKVHNIENREKRRLAPLSSEFGGWYSSSF